MTRRLRFTVLANQEFEELIEMSELFFGSEQTDLYIDKFTGKFDQIRQFPDTGRVAFRGEADVYVVRAETHYIYFSYTDLDLTVLRIIHTARDQKKAYRAAND